MGHITPVLQGTVIPLIPHYYIQAVGNSSQIRHHGMKGNLRDDLTWAFHFTDGENRPWITEMTLLRSATLPRDHSALLWCLLLFLSVPHVERTGNHQPHSCLTLKRANSKGSLNHVYNHPPPAPPFDPHQFHEFCTSTRSGLECSSRSFKPLPSLVCGPKNCRTSLIGRGTFPKEQNMLFFLF